MKGIFKHMQIWVKEMVSFRSVTIEEMLAIKREGPKETGPTSY